MKINTNSLHYKWVKLISRIVALDSPQDLCSYIRRMVIWPLAILAIFPVICFFMIIVLAVTVFMNIVTLPFGYYDFSPLMSNCWKRYNGLKIGNFSLYPYHLLYVAGVVCAFVFHIHYAFQIATLVPLVCFGVFLLFSNKPLIAEYLKAKKEKVCPLIIFTNGDDNDL